MKNDLLNGIRIQISFILLIKEMLSLYTPEMIYKKNFNLLSVIDLRGGVVVYLSFIQKFLDSNPGQGYNKKLIN